MISNHKYWPGISESDILIYKFERSRSFKNRSTREVQAAMLTSLEAAADEANSDAPEWLQLARRLPDELRAALVAELRAVSELIGISNSSWPSESGVVATIDARFTVTRNPPPAGVVWAGYDKMPRSWREDLSHKVGGVAHMLMT